MLPDFLALKFELLKEQSYAVTHNRSGEPLLSQIASYIHHEGKGFILLREDGTQETSDYRLMSGEIRIDLKDIQKKGEAAIDEALNPANKEINETQRKALFETLNRTVPSHDAGGRPISAELILEMWESMDFSFDENGNWQRPTIVINPIQAPRLTKELKRMETEPNLIQRFEELLAQKKRDWDDREANRKLVD
jgi:hypothetical protein